jgi:indolepyruvate ferredoxin oxidoreductase beta subunit
LAKLEQEVAATMPEVAHDVMREGVRRLAAYQDLVYARLYVDRLGPIRDADGRAGGSGCLLAETARQLAVRMSFEDVIRVAEAKIDPQRFTRIMREMSVAPGEPFAVVEFLKPGIEEMCSILPPRVARPILRLAQRRGWLGRAHFAMEVRTTSVTGYLRLRLLANLRRFRRTSLRYQEEQAEIERWLDLIRRAAALSGGLAIEIAACARLIKGYGDTHRRGSENYRLIASRIIAPALAGRLAPHAAIDAVASARTAALADPDGEALSRCLAEIERQTSVRLAAE